MRGHVIVTPSSSSEKFLLAFLLFHIVFSTEAEHWEIIILREVVEFISIHNDNSVFSRIVINVIFFVFEYKLKLTL